MLEETPVDALRSASAVEAGGLVPPGSPVPKDLPVDTVDARGYRHPGMPDRVVVRLVPDAIAAGIDTEMSLLGFGLSDHADDIALQRRRTLGFPGHALVTDPDHARYALDVMKEFKTHAKRIGSKPGHAKEGFDGIAERLARQVPHFLPSYWEEVGRAFSTAGNTSYAAQSFDKARAAEREFGLVVDEERRGEAFLEFALLGALSVKSLQSYGKELQKSVGPAKGYERMFGLAVRRTLGGLPPWASLPKDLRSLAKAAKLDLAAEDERLLREVLGANAIARAPIGFWDEYRDAVLRLAKSDPKIRSRLLDILPNGGKTRYSWRGDDSGFDDSWVQLLAEAGALETLWTADAPADALPAGGRAAWLGRYQEWAKPTDGWAMQILRRAAPALKADGAPIPLRCGDWYKPLDLDLLDLLLELGLRWEPISAWGIRVDLAKWADRPAIPARAWASTPPSDGALPAEDRPRDPVFAARDPKVAALLAPAIDSVFGNPVFEAVATGKAGLRDLRRAWLEQQVADLDATGIAATAVALERLEVATTAATFAEFPEAYQRLQAAQVGAALHRALVTGLFDELHWPAFDGVVAELDPKPDVELKVFRQWPHLIVANGRKALVIGAGGREHAHDLKLGKDQLPDGLVWVGGQLWVGSGTWQNGWQRKAYWSSAPQDTFEVENTSAPMWSLPIEHPDAVVNGPHRFTVGDRTAPPQVQYGWYDRTGAWTLVDGVVRAMDRATGALVDGPPPSFMADVLDRAAGAWYYGVPEEVAATSPLGVIDGQWGCKHVGVAPTEDEDGDEVAPTSEMTLVTLAGDRYTGTVRHGTARWLASALVRWPGSDQPRAVVEQVQWWRNGHNPSFFVADPDRPIVALIHHEAVRMARAWLPPLLYWHYLVPRDLAGSRALRSCDREAADALLAAPTVETVRAKLPAITDPALQAGVVHVAELASGYAERLAKLVETRVGGVAVATRSTPEVQDQAATGPFGNLRRYWAWGDGTTVTGAVRTLGRFLREGENGEGILFSKLEPHEWIGRIRGVAASAARPGTSGPDREVMQKVLRAWSESGLADDGHLRVGSLTFSKADPAWMPVREVDGKHVPHGGWRHSEADNRLFAWGASEHDHAGPWSVTFVEWARDGAFRAWPGAEITAERRERIEGDRAWLEAFLTAFAANGARAAREDEAAALAEATGLSAAEAACVLAAFPQEMDKETRAGFGLKAAEVKAAALQLPWSIDQKLELLRDVAPAAPADLWRAGAEAFARAWLARRTKVVAVPAELLVLAGKELGRVGGALLKGVANPADWTTLDQDATFVVGPDGALSSGGGFDGATASHVAQVVAWLCGKLPVGDPLLRGVVGVFERARKRAAHPGLICGSGRWQMYEPKARKAAEAFFDALGGEVVPSRNEDGSEEVGWQRRSGPFVSTKAAWYVELAFRPSELDAGSRELLDAFVRASGNSSNELGAIDVLQSDDFAALVKRVADTPLHPGQWEQDPSRSAPSVVVEVAGKHGISSEAATLYLQTLALLEPTRKNVIEWNGWSPKTYGSAVAELVGQGLVLEAKRARAGREHFLPGAWVEQSSILPYEQWKQALYGFRAGYPLGQPLLLAPVHVVFERAWARCLAGDAPRFEEVRR